MHEHETQTELAGRLAAAHAQVVVGTRYAHYKQGTYVVLAVGLQEENTEVCVIYQAEYGEKLTWIRPLTSWLERVEVGSKTTLRFTKLEP